MFKLKIIINFALQIQNTKDIIMIIVPLKEGDSIDKALKKLKRKFEKTGISREVRERKQFTKPSILKREQKQKAIYVQGLRQEKMDS